MIDYDWEVDYGASAKFSAIVKRDVALTKFSAVTAKEILKAADKFGADRHEVFEFIRKWMERLYEAGLDIESEGKDTNEEN